jgi:hypothetical protein
VLLRLARGGSGSQAPWTEASAWPGRRTPARTWDATLRGTACRCTAGAGLKHAPSSRPLRAPQKWEVSRLNWQMYPSSAPITCVLIQIAQYQQLILVCK